jgi:putative transposase
MANTFTQIYIHYIFSTKKRKPLIQPHMEKRLFAYIGGTAREYGYTVIANGGMPDHIHTLAGIPASMNISKVVQILKSTSSKWMNDTFYPNRDFRWQSGYGGFSIGQSNLQDAVRYLNNQKHHHQTISFQEEYLRFLKKYGIDYAEKYVWG